MRLILDTNILLSALLSPAGAPAKLLDAWERKTVTLVACDALIAELRDVAAPLAVQLTGANRNDSQQALALVDAIPGRLRASTYGRDAKPDYEVAACNDRYRISSLCVANR